MSDLEQTQAIYLEDFDDETDDENTDGKKKIVSFLKVVKQEGYPEKLFPLYDGDNVIGRQEDTCNIAIPLKALSRQHACIEIRGENHLIYDKGSRNKTKKGKLFLTPQVRYELKDKDTLLFGDVQCVYIVGEPDNLDDSETGSESGFQTAPTDPVENRGTSHVTTLVYDSEEEDYNSDNSVDLLQPTQAYVQKHDESKKSRINFDLDTDEDESERKSPDITVKETPAPRKTQGVISTVVMLPESGSETEDEESPPSGKKDGQSEKSGNSSLFQAPTQAFIIDSDGETTEEDSPKKKLLFAATQSFMGGKSKQTGSPQGIVLGSDDEDEKDENIPVVEVDDDEEEEEDRSHLFANPTLACDLPEEIKDSSDEQEEEEENKATAGEDPEAETQVFTDSTVAVSDETLEVSAVKGAGKTKAGKKKERDARGASTVEIKIDEGENDATQDFSDITGGATLAVGNEGECESTQVFDNITEAETVAVQCEATQVLDEKVAETVAVECEATQVFDEKVAEAETVAIECEATQVFDEKVTEAETVAIECEATQVFDEKVTEAETVAIECEATQVFDENVAAEAETMAIDSVADGKRETEAETVALECDATQVFDDETTEAITKDRRSTQRFNKKKSVAKTECEATLVLDNVSSNTGLRKECSDSSAETVALECEPTQVFDDVDAGEGDRTESSKSSAAASETDAKDSDESDVKNRGTSTKSKPKSTEGEGSGEVQPKRSGRISKRKMAAEDKAVEKVQETVTKKGRGRKGKGRKKTEDDAEELISSGGEATETEEGVSKTSTGLDEIDSRVLNAKSDRSDAGVEQTVQYDMELDEDLQPTQAYCMEVDEDQSDTLSISEVAELESATPTEEVKITEDTPDILPVPIPPTSPHRSAMASPGRRSPSPKKVHFEKRESEFTLDEASGSKLKPKDKLSVGKSSGRNRRSLPNLPQPAVPARGRRGRLSENLTVEAETQPSSAVTSKGRRGAKAQTTESPKTAGKGKSAKVIQKEDTPPLEEIENVNAPKLEENPIIEEEATQVIGRGKRGKSKRHEAQPHTNVSTSAPSDEGEKEKKVAEEAEVNSRKGKGGRRSKVSGSDEQTVVSKDLPSGVKESEQQEESSSRGRGRRKAKILDDEKEQSHSDTKTGKGKGKIIENSEGEESETADSDSGGRKSLKSRRRGAVEEVNKSAVEKSQTDEIPAELETNKRTKGRRSLTNTETKTESESVPAGRKVRTRKSDTTVTSKEEEDVDRQTTGEDVVKDLEESKKNQRGSKRSKKKETLDNISEETVNSVELPSTSSHNTRTKQRTSKEHSEEIDEVKNSVENKSETPSRKGRRKEKVEQTKDDVQENETSDDSSSKKVQRNRRNVVTKQAQDNVPETGESQESVASTESVPTRRGRGKAAAKQNSQEDSGSKRRSRGRDVSAGRKSAAESQGRENSISRDSESDKAISPAKTKGSNRKVKGDQKDTPPIASDTELSSDSQDSTKPRGASKRGRGRQATEEVTPPLASDTEIGSVSQDSTKPRGASKRGRGRHATEEVTPPVASDTEMSSDSQDSTKPRGASKRGRGRQATEEAKEEVPGKKSKMEPPSTPKQAKKSAKSTDSPSSALRRKSMDPSKPKVMFTGVTDEQGQKVVKDLGGQLVDAVQECTHLVTDKVRRTVKFLCCLARGIPIVNPLWLDSCKSSGMFGDHTPFLVQDEAAQRQYKFVLHKSLEKASEASLLSGYQIHVTKSVKPDPANMKDIITCAGAEYLTTLPKKAGDRVVVISCPDDRGACDAAVKAGVTIVNAEFILTGILKQEIAIENYILFQDKKRSRDSSAGGPSSKRRR